MSPEPWRSLVAGDRFFVKSKSGNPYELTFIHSASDESGILVRLEVSRKPARFYPPRLDWTTFQKLVPGPILAPGDELLLATAEHRALRGRILALSPDLVSLRLATDKLLAVRTADVVAQSVRLVFAATDWLPGDEFLIQSRSGREYRGLTQRVSSDRIEAVLLGRENTPLKETAVLRVDQLDVSSFRVLVPVGLASLAAV